jgi:phenylalanine-4-hydroxylase
MYTTDNALLRPDMRMAFVDQWDIHRVPVPAYTDTEHATWTTLLANQRQVLPGRACGAFLDGLDRIGFPDNRIPALADISDRIEQCTGWRLVRVDGIVPDEQFFSLLANRLFPSTDFIRKPDEIGYTPAPDMFHDLLGHAPLLTNARFCSFFQRFGEAGCRAFELSHPARLWLPRIYWYTVEFGLIRDESGLRIYGAGILSSPNEVGHCLSGQPARIPFDIDIIASTSYDIWHMQQQLFVIDSFDQLEDAFYRWSDQLFAS